MRCGATVTVIVNMYVPTASDGVVQLTFCPKVEQLKPAGTTVLTYVTSLASATLMPPFTAGSGPLFFSVMV